MKRFGMPVGRLGQSDMPLSEMSPYPPGKCLPPWIYPPATFENIETSGYVAIPAIAASVDVISFLMPSGRNGIIKKIANNFVGGGWVEGSGSITWAILIDDKAPDGFGVILNSLGNPSSPTEIAGIRVFEGEKVRLQVTNVSVAVAGQLIGGRFLGWRYPREIEDPDIWSA
jgi:hypothetical protein